MCVTSYHKKRTFHVSGRSYMTLFVQNALNRPLSLRLTWEPLTTMKSKKIQKPCGANVQNGPNNTFESKNTTFTCPKNSFLGISGYLVAKVVSAVQMGPTWGVPPGDEKSFSSSKTHWKCSHEWKHAYIFLFLRHTRFYGAAMIHQNVENDEKSRICSSGISSKVVHFDGQSSGEH